jgi:hypothetical protein
MPFNNRTVDPSDQHLRIRSAVPLLLQVASNVMNFHSNGLAATLVGFSLVLFVADNRPVLLQMLQTSRLRNGWFEKGRNLVAQSAFPVTAFFLLAVILTVVIAWQGARMSVLRARVESLSEAQWPRLAAAEKTELETALKGILHGPVLVMYSDSSGIGLGSDLASVFKTLGCQVSLTPYDSTDSGNIVPGLTISAKPDNQAAVRLRDILRRFGLTSSLDVKDYAQDYAIAIVIGIRQPS